MTLVAAAVVPAAPLLVPALAGGSAAADAGLRAQVRDAVAAVTASGADLVVVGAGESTGPLTGTWDWAPLGVPVRGTGEARLPLPLALGAWWLDELVPGRARTFLSVEERADVDSCRELGRALAVSGDVALLVVGDGSARRSETAPGHFDPRAQAYDEQAEAALRVGNPEALLQLDPTLGAELLAQGRAPWQVLAGAAQGCTWNSEVLYAEAPYGVCYLVATWHAAGAT